MDGALGDCFSVLRRLENGTDRLDRSRRANSRHLRAEIEKARSLRALRHLRKP